MKKRCSKCGEPKDADQFCRDKSRIDGRDPQCKECRHEYGRRYYEANKAKIVGKVKEWREAHPEQARKYARDWARDRYAQDPEKFREALRVSRAKHHDRRLEDTRRWRANNPDKVRGYNVRYWRENHEANVKRFRRWAQTVGGVVLQRRRDAVRRGAQSKSFVVADWKERLDGFNGHCAYCLKPMPKVTMDHMDPISRGGEHSIENVVPACMRCNQRKNARTLLEFLVLQQADHRRPALLSARSLTACGPSEVH